MAEKWIPRNLERGAFTRKAKAAGMTVAEYARHVLSAGSRASTKTKRQANLALRFREFAKAKRKKRDKAISMAARRLRKQ